MLIAFRRCQQFVRGHHRTAEGDSDLVEQVDLNRAFHSWRNCTIQAFCGGD